MKEHRPLILRSNRFLGSTLVNKNLIKVDDLENANQKLLEIVQADNLKGASLLNILLFQLRSVEENTIINAVLEEHHLGLIDLANYELLNTAPPDLDVDLCWATWTVPFDRVDKFTFLATAYYLSQPAIKAWEDKIQGPIVWYVSNLSSITTAIQALDERAAQAVKKLT